MTKKTTCRICERTNQNEIYIGKEMMYGTREEFEYFQCKNCNCLQISEIPNDLSRFYPADSYYSMVTDNSVYYKNPLKNFYKYLKDNLILNILHQYPHWLESGGDEIVYGTRSMTNLKKINHNSNILDIGCGSGVLLYRLRNAGFYNATGNDPFTKEIITQSGETIISNKPFKDSQEKYDLVMMHHALEHVPNPVEVLKDIKKILKPNGQILIRIPYVDSYCWEQYKENWMQMDPPRHLYLHSEKSIQIMLKEVGLNQDNVIFDANMYAIVGSEQNKLDISMQEEKSYLANRNSSIFSSNQLKKFESISNKSNIESRGDQVCLYLSAK
jgi:SAM-dependent methyltransferase